jgi:hypothetical protein
MGRKRKKMRDLLSSDSDIGLPGFGTLTGEGDTMDSEWNLSDDQLNQPSDDVLYEQQSGNMLNDDNSVINDEPVFPDVLNDDPIFPDSPTRSFASVQGD